MKRIVFNIYAVFLLIPLAFASEAQNINKFAFEFYKSMQGEQEGENLVFSPYYLYKVLGDLQFCLDGEISKQIGKVLQNSNADSSSGELEDNDVLKSATSLWLASSQALNTGFVKYSSETLALDIFGEDLQNAESLKEKIFAWAKSKPDILGKDCEMLRDISFSENLAAVLLSISSFDAKWKVPFDRRNTRAKTFFYGEDLSQKAEIDFMYRYSRDIAYEQTEKFQLAKVPYEGDKYSMVFIKPRPSGDLNTIDGDVFSNLLQILRDSEFTYGEIHLPKFSIKKSLDCISALKKMGIDFSRPVKAKFFSSDKSWLFLGKFFSSCLIELDEVSTKVKSVNYADFVWGGVSLNLNSPFMFFIVENESGAIIYMGKFCKPEASQIKDAKK